MNVTNQNQSLVKSELRQYFIGLTIYNVECFLASETKHWERENNEKKEKRKNQTIEERD